jgi:hypothetical protein
VLSQSTCSQYYPFNEGSTFQFTNYDKKGKTTGIVDYLVSNVNTLDGVEVATIASSVKDEKGEVLFESSYDITCENDQVSIDFNSLVNPQMMQQYQDFDVEVSGTNIDLPNNLSVGQELPDASMLMTINMGIMMNFTVDITNRKVIAREDVTTSAGTFDCFVISYNSDIKMGFKRKGISKQWIAEGVGMVKQEEYNKKGKLVSSSKLTAYND